MTVVLTIWMWQRYVRQSDPRGMTGLDEMTRSRIHHHRHRGGNVVDVELIDANDTRRTQNGTRHDSGRTVVTTNGDLSVG